MDEKIKLPCHTRLKEEHYIIDTNLKIICKYRLKAAANNDIHDLRKTGGYDLKIVTKEEYKELKRVTTK